MFTNNNQEVTPTVDVAINKSRIKQHNKKSEIPTYYLKDGSEFQLELFNPTTDVVLAKIEINNKLISQSGLILNPGQRVFLERYLDIDRKFKFETYEVNDTKEVQAAIANNGDLKVLFYKEVVKQNPIITLGSTRKTFFNQDNRNNIGGQGIQPQGGLGGVLRGDSGTWNGGATFTTNSMDINASVSTFVADTNDLTYTAGATLDSMANDFLDLSSEVKSEPASGQYKKRLKRKTKTIESGRVEKGSVSDQKFVTVDKDFEYSPFCTIEYKILPVSQKPQTVKDVVTNNYCTQCGFKVKGTFRFCPQCGSKV